MVAKDLLKPGRTSAQPALGHAVGVQRGDEAPAVLTLQGGSRATAPRTSAGLARTKRLTPAQRAAGGRGHHRGTSSSPRVGRRRRHGPQSEGKAK
eukprot:9389040-Alexandrium_andersonii.AAC.1